MTEPRLVKNIGTSPDGTPWATYAVQEVQLNQDGVPIGLEGHAIRLEGASRETFSATMQAVTAAESKPGVTYNWDTHAFEAE